MTCPDNLLVAYRKGALSLEDRARLDAHLARCTVCPLTLRAGRDFDDELHTLPGDDLIADRFARTLGPRFVAAERAPLRDRKGAGAWPLVAAAAVVVALLASGGLAAASLGVWPFPEAREVEPAPATREKTLPARRAAPVEPAPPSPAVEEPAPVAELPTAAELFARANAHRRRGEAARARAVYGQLIQHYPRSSEAEVAHVSLGRVQLELGEPARALAQFDRYLARRSRGPLAEEALFGKATALARLGRTDAERRTWETLLAAYPSSIYADRARARLERER